MLCCFALSKIKRHMLRVCFVRFKIYLPALVRWFPSSVLVDKLEFEFKIKKDFVCLGVIEQMKFYSSFWSSGMEGK